MYVKRSKVENMRVMVEFLLPLPGGHTIKYNERFKNDLQNNQRKNANLFLLNV